MSRERLVLKVEEKKGEVKVLFWGEDFPFIAEAIKQKLQKKNCQIFLKLQNQPFDYILIFGQEKNIPKLAQGLKENGKILLILSEEKEKAHLDKNIPVFPLVTSKSLTAETLTRKILKKLFLSRSYKTADRKSEPGTGLYLAKPKAVPKSSLKKAPRKISSKKVIPIALILTLFFLLIVSPFIFLASNLFLGAKNLQKIKLNEISLEEREKAIISGKTQIKMAKKTFFFLRPVIFLAFPKTGFLLEETVIFLENVSLAGQEGIFLEKLFNKESQSFLKSEANLLNERLNQIEEKLSLIDDYLSIAELSVKNLASEKESFFLRKYWSFFEKIPSLRKDIIEGRKMVTIIPEVFGLEKERKYLLLLQNNFELRPTGGFIGSYGVLVFNNGRLTKLNIEDVYTADGQLKGHVEPPAPLALYLNQPNWFLRDSNWDPDFFFSAEKALWFIKKETGEDFDGVFALDLYFLQKLLAGLDGVYVPDYQAKITAEDFFLKLQAEKQEGFFPGSTKKKDLLSALSSALLIELSESKNLPVFSLLKAVRESLIEKHLLIYLQNKKAQEVIENLGFGGRIVSVNCQRQGINCLEDYLMLVEANLGVNKVNYHLKRELTTSISLSKESLKREVSIYYLNRSPGSNGFFSGTYKNYLRVLLPQSAVVKSIKAEKKVLNLLREVDLENYQDKKSLGLLVEIPPKEQMKVVLEYELPLPESKSFTYQLLIQKQPGTEGTPFLLKKESLLNWRIKNLNFLSFPYLDSLATDKLFLIDFER